MNAEQFSFLDSADAVELLSERATSKNYRIVKGSHAYLYKEESFFSDDTETDTVYAITYELSELMRSYGAPLPRWYLSNDGAPFVRKNGVVSTVRDFVEGTEFTATASEIEHIGEDLARFHQVGRKVLAAEPALLSRLKTLPLEKPFGESAVVYQQQLKRDLATRSGHSAESASESCQRAEVCDYIRQNLEAIDALFRSTMDFYRHHTGQEVVTVLHFDLRWDNVVMDAHGHVAAYIDWGYVNGQLHGDRMLDVADGLTRFSEVFCKNHPHRRLKEFVETYLEAYNRIEPLSDYDYAALVPSMTRMQLFRMLRIMRRHHYENDRLGEACQKLKDRLIPLMLRYEADYGFVARSK